MKSVPLPDMKCMKNMVAARLPEPLQASDM